MHPSIKPSIHYYIHHFIHHPIPLIHLSVLHQPIQTYIWPETAHSTTFPSADAFIIHPPLYPSFHSVYLKLKFIHPSILQSIHLVSICICPSDHPSINSLWNHLFIHQCIHHFAHLPIIYAPIRTFIRYFFISCPSVHAKFVHPFIHPTFSQATICPISSHPTLIHLSIFQWNSQIYLWIFDGIESLCHSWSPCWRCSSALLGGSFFAIYCNRTLRAALNTRRALPLSTIRSPYCWCIALLSFTCSVIKS